MWFITISTVCWILADVPAFLFATIYTYLFLRSERSDAMIEFLAFKALSWEWNVLMKLSENSIQFSRFLAANIYWMLTLSCPCISLHHWFLLLFLSSCRFLSHHIIFQPFLFQLCISIASYCFHRLIEMFVFFNFHWFIVKSYYLHQSLVLFLIAHFNQ